MTALIQTALVCANCCLSQTFRRPGSGSVWARSLTESTLSLLAEGFDMTDLLTPHFERQAINLS
jgi:hypothetical protein